MRSADVAFYCVADHRHFIGLVALLNSLRLAGHTEPFFVVDAGLTADQRALLLGEATIIPGPDDVPAVFLKPFGPLHCPAHVAVIVDADIIVIRPLTELIEVAQGGQLVGFVNKKPDHARFFSEWSATLGLDCVRREPYLNCGFLVIPGSIAHRLLAAWDDAQGRVDFAGTRYGGASLSDPFYFADQDVLNAVVSSRLSPAEIAVMAHRLTPHQPFAGLRLVDRDRLVCRYADGSSPFLLHHTLAKPWLKATPKNPYSLLLPRLLLAPDAAIRLLPKQVPLRLREGWLGRVDRSRANLQAVTTERARRRLGKLGIRRRLPARHQGVRRP